MADPWQLLETSTPAEGQWCWLYDGGAVAWLDRWSRGAWGFRDRWPEMLCEPFAFAPLPPQL